MCYAKVWGLYTIVLVCLINLALGNEPKIVIIGAGPSGIAAASRLYEYGFKNVTILEAENRIGGRVHTVWFAESWMDLGGQWVHGQTNNVVFELASPLGLLEVPEETEGPFLIYSSEGSLIPTSISDEIMEWFSDLKLKALTDFQGYNGSIGEYFMQKLTIEAAKHPTVNQTLIKPFIHLLENSEKSIHASHSWYHTSARQFLENWDCPGKFNVNWKDKGYATILDILTKKYPNPENELPVFDNTILNSEVININYSSTEGKVLVKTSNGEKYTADHVIVTPSLGVLKEQYEILFTPQLPKYKIKVIKGLSIGAVAKLYYSFEEAWWPDDSRGFCNFLWTESDRQEYENDPERKWLLDVIGFHPVAHRPRILHVWINAPGSNYMETLQENQVLNETLAILHKFVGNYYNITRVTGFVRSTWQSNKHFRGAYSSRSMETENADVWAEDLAVPIIVNNKSIVMFAGEATHPHYYSTVHGAIESGFREADRLIAAYNKSIPV